MFELFKQILQDKNLQGITLQVTNLPGDQLRVIFSPQGGPNSKIKNPLMLTATAAEFDSEFAASILHFNAVRQSIGEQVVQSEAALTRDSITHKTASNTAKDSDAVTTSAEESHTNLFD